MPQLQSYTELAQPNHQGWPRTVVGLLLNDPAVLPSLGDQVNQPPYKAPPQKPVLYIKPANTYAKSGASIVIPADIEQVQVGACLGIEIGRTATRLTLDNALEHVVGYRLVADLTVPHAMFYRPAIKQKCRDGFCPMGELTARDDIADPDAVVMNVSIDGGPVVAISTANRVRSVRQALVDVTEFMSLHPGDILLLGISAEPPLAKAGQSYQVQANGFQTLTNTLVAA